MYYTQGLSEKQASSNPPAGSAKSAGLHSEVCEELRKPFSAAEMTYCQQGSESRDRRAVLEAMPDPARLLERLDRVLGPGGYSFWYDLTPAGTVHTATCHLRIGGAVRSGVYAHGDPEEAAGRALVRAAQAFHIGWQPRAAGRFVARLPLQEGEVPGEIVERFEGKGLTPPPLGSEAPRAEGEQGKEAGT